MADIPRQEERVMNGVPSVAPRLTLALLSLSYYLPTIQILYFHLDKNDHNFHRFRARYNVNKRRGGAEANANLGGLACVTEDKWRSECARPDALPRFLPNYLETCPFKSSLIKESQQRFQKSQGLYRGVSLAVTHDPWGSYEAENARTCGHSRNVVTYSFTWSYLEF